MNFPSSHEQRVRSAIERAESKTGAQIVAAMTPKSDAYPEIPWKAFAFAAAAGALDVAVSAHLGFPHFSTPFSAALGILAPAGLATLAAIFLKPFARLFLSRARAEQESLQYAKGLFLDHGLAGTRERDGILICVSLFEHQVTVLPDIGIGAKIPQSAWQSVVDAMRELLADGRPVEAMESGIARLEAVLLEKGLRGKPGQADELSNAVLTEKGEA